MGKQLNVMAWMALGGAMGVGATFALREATRTPIPELGALQPPSEKPLLEPVPPPGIDTLPAQPAPAGTAKPPPTPSAPPPRPPAFDFFGFAVAGRGTNESGTFVPSAPPGTNVPDSFVPRPAVPKVLRFEPMKERCAAGFDATSTLHDFRGWTKSVAGWVRFEADRLEETAAASFVVDARTLDTNNPDRDKEMHADYLHTAKFPEFRFELKEFRRTSKDRPDGPFTMKGLMKIHGVSKEVEIPGTLMLRKDGYLHVKGEVRRKMSDFGISPPVTALIIRVDDEIKIWFELWARRQEDKP